jgi:hypothetical protein
MMKHLRTIGAVTAALAASAVLLAPALAQQGPGGLAGAPGYQQQRDNNYNDRNGDWDRNDYSDRNPDWRRRSPDINWATEQCSRAANRDAERRNFFSAQYDGKAPRLVEGRRGWELHGRLRIHDPRGMHYENAICDLRNGRGGVSIDYLR